MLEKRLLNRDVSRFLYMNKDEDMVFKRMMFLILGQKRKG
jgi:hypothetical protein